MSITGQVSSEENPKTRFGKERKYNRWALLCSSAARPKPGCCQKDKKKKHFLTRGSRVTHDHASSVALGDLVGGEGGLDVVEAEATLGAEPPPVTVVVAVDAGAARLVADLMMPAKPRRRVGRRRGRQRRRLCIRERSSKWRRETRERHSGPQEKEHFVSPEREAG